MNETNKKLSPVIKIPLYYLAFSTIYILLSDKLVADISKQNAELNQQLQSLKGICFVILSALFIFILSRKYFKQLKESFSRKEDLLNNLNSTREEFFKQQLNFRKTLALSVIDAQESERNRWAEELHDNALQLLTVAKLYIDMVMTNKEKMNMLAESRSLLLSAIEEIRTISHNIKPPHFETMSLPESINVLIDNIRRFKHYQVDLHISELADQRLSRDQKIMVYRIIQEQLNNILKYAEADAIRIHLDVKDNKAELVISDNGKGYDPNSIRHGIGISNMHSRLEPYSGTLDIISAPGQGFEIRANFNIIWE